jgi:hypothetical protein
MRAAPGTSGAPTEIMTRPLCASGPVIHQPRISEDRAEARLRGNRALAAAVLIAVGAATLLPLDSVARFFAIVSVPDLVRTIVGVLLVANGSILILPRLAFVGTMVPMVLAVAAVVVSWHAGELSASSRLLVLSGSVALLVVLGRLAWNTRPRGLPGMLVTPGTRDG